MRKIAAFLSLVLALELVAPISGVGIGATTVMAAQQTEATVEAEATTEETASEEKATEETATEETTTEETET